jgi:hypothetical protein
MRLLWFATCGFALFATGCLRPRMGPQSVPRDRSLYSLSLSDSWKEQTLLNIVKVRYIDYPVFVDIGSIVASYTLSQNASVGGTIQSGTNNAVLGGSVTFSNSPTITYVPLTGNAYIKGLTIPLPPETVFAAIQNGFPADAILLSSVQSINGLRNQQVDLNGVTPADPDFHRVRELMRNIQVSGAVRLYVKEDGNKQQTNILGLRTQDIPPEIEAASTELRRLLHLNPEATEFPLVSAPLPSNDTEVAVQTRSISGMLQNMAAQVEVPSEDVAQHRAFPGIEQGHTLPGIIPMIVIHSSKKKPDNAFVNVYYRDTWFWIDDGDLISKRALLQLMQLFTMIDSGPRQNQPVVTIPSR